MFTAYAPFRLLPWEGFFIKRLDNCAIVPLEKYQELVPTAHEILKKPAKQ